MRSTLGRSSNSKRVKFALEPQVKHINNHPSKNNSPSSDDYSKIISNNPISKSPSVKPISRPTSNETPVTPELHTVQSQCELFPEIQKKHKSRKHSQKLPEKSKQKCAVFLSAATNDENSENPINVFSFISSDSGAICCTHAKQTGQIRPRNWSKPTFPIGLEHYSECLARWLCHRQVSNAMQFWTNIQQWTDSHQRILLAHPKPTGSASAPPRSPRRSSSVPTTTVHSRYFKRSDGLRLVSSSSELRALEICSSTQTPNIFVLCLSD